MDNFNLNKTRDRKVSCVAVYERIYELDLPW